MTLLGIQTHLCLTVLFSSIPTNLLCLYFIHVDLIQPFCRFQFEISAEYTADSLLFSATRFSLALG